MSKSINSGKVLQFATDEQCQDRRDALIGAGIIKVSEDRKFDPVVHRRKPYIDAGIIRPLEEGEDGCVTYCSLPEKENRRLFDNEEGTYVPKPIRSDREYQRKKQVYFRMLQEIIWSRQNCNLILGKISDDDPAWYF